MMLIYCFTSDDGGEHMVGESYFWLNSEPSLATEGIESHVESKDLGKEDALVWLTFIVICGWIL